MKESLKVTFIGLLGSSINHADMKGRRECCPRVQINIYKKALFCKIVHKGPGIKMSKKYSRGLWMTPFGYLINCSYPAW